MRYLYHIAVFATVTVLAGCVTTPEQKEKPDVAVQQVEQISVSNRLKRAIQYLQNGNNDEARRDLEIIITQHPNHRVAKDLINQMDMDPKEYLGTEHFLYTSQPKDSLSVIAERFLGDSLQFIILSRYNQIENPSRLTVGDTLKIPGKRSLALPEEKAPKLPVQMPGEPSKYALAKKHYDAQNYRDAITTLEKEQEKDITEEARNLLLLSYSAQADKLAAQKQLKSARVLLEKAQALDPSNDQIAMQLASLDDMLLADRFYKQGMAYTASGELDKAYDSFSQALVYEPDHAMASKGLKKTRQTLVTRYHKEAMSLYRRHNLDKAIEIWDKVLVLDPQYEPAMIYRTRALELQEKLKNL